MEAVFDDGERRRVVRKIDLAPRSRAAASEQRPVLWRRSQKDEDGKAHTNDPVHR